jgi:hypothetical protein
MLQLKTHIQKLKCFNKKHTYKKIEKVQQKTHIQKLKWFKKFLLPRIANFHINLPYFRTENSFLELKKKEKNIG